MEDLGMMVYKLMEQALPFVAMCAAFMLGRQG